MTLFVPRHERFSYLTETFMRSQCDDPESPSKSEVEVVSYNRSIKEKFPFLKKLKSNLLKFFGEKNVFNELFEARHFELKE